MKYISVVKKFEKKHYCPFCNEKPEHMIEIGKYFYVIPARAPYIKDHLLIIPKRHVNTMVTLSPAEVTEMYKLVHKRAKKLRTQYENINILLRDGLVKDTIINKSVNHLHVHILPNTGVHIETPDSTVNPKIKKEGENRERLEDKAYTQLSKNIQKRFLAQ